MDRDSPHYVQILQTHNRRIGTPLQRAVRKVVGVYLLGLPLWVLTNVFLRVRVVDGRHYDGLRPHAILALRHFYEWDPMVTYCAFGLVRALRAGNPPLTIASDLWARSAWRRPFSWFLGVLSLVSNNEPEGALARSLELLTTTRRLTLAICPTGPIGQSKRYRVGYSVGHLAVHRPDVPIVPVSVMGIQELRWSRILTLRRPRVTVIFGEPLYGAKLPEGSSATRQKVMCERIDAAWQAMEANMV